MRRPGAYSPWNLLQAWLLFGKTKRQTGMCSHIPNGSRPPNVPVAQYRSVRSLLLIDTHPYRERERKEPLACAHKEGMYAKSSDSWWFHVSWKSLTREQDAELHFPAHLTVTEASPARSSSLTVACIVLPTSSFFPLRSLSPLKD